MDDRHRELWTRWAALIVLALAELSTSSAQELHLPLPVEEVARMHYFASDDTPIGFSPDGRWLTYTIISPDEVRVPIGFTEFHTATGVPFLFAGASVWVSNLKSKQAIRLMDAGSNSWGGSWSPDGRLLAFYSDRGGQAGLWVWEKATGKSRRITEAIARPSRGSDVPQWMPDSKHVIIRVLPKGMTIEKANSFAPTGPASQASSDETASAIVVYKSPAEDKSGNPPESTWLSRRYLGDLVQIDVITGTVLAIVHSATAIAYSVSPDGTNLAIAEYRKHRVASQQSLYALKVVSLNTGEVRTIADEVEMYGGDSFSWSPDGKHLAYMTTGPAGMGVISTAKGDIYVAELNGSAPRLLTDGPHPHFGDEDKSSKPLWDSTGAILYCIGEKGLYEIPFPGHNYRHLTKNLNREVLGVFAPPASPPPAKERNVNVYTRDSETKRFGVYQLDLKTGKNAKLLEADISIRATPVISAEGGTWAYVAESAEHGPDVWVMQKDSPSPEQITSVNPQLDKYAMGHSRLIEWRSLDGKLLHGALLLPADYQAGKSYPLIVWVYGGEFGSDSLERFGPWGASALAFDTQVLATRGYAVLCPDAPLRKGTPVRDLAATILPGVNRVIELGIADPDRLGVMGQSYGGYSTLALITQTTRFKAAVASAASGDLGSMYGQLGRGGLAQSVGWAEQGQGRMGGPPWQYPERYVENSPFYHLDRVETPLLLVQGTEDFTGVTQSDEIFVGLQRLGKKVEYRQYKGEGHVVRSYANTTDFLSRKIAWFDDHLKK